MPGPRPHTSEHYMRTAKSLGLLAVVMLMGLLNDDTLVRVVAIAAASLLAMAAYANYRYATGR